MAAPGWTARELRSFLPSEEELNAPAPRDEVANRLWLAQLRSTLEFIQPFYESWRSQHEPESEEDRRLSREISELFRANGFVKELLLRDSDPDAEAPTCRRVQETTNT